ncbi:hypothetical protein B7463_g12665, partial [Scytalidium lignicola]
MASTQSVQCFGKKKTATAVAHAGKGLIKVNGKPLSLVQPEILRFKVYEPLLILGLDKFSNVDIRVRVSGGGHTSQIYAIRQAIAKSLVAYYQKYDVVNQRSLEVQVQERGTRNLTVKEWAYGMLGSVMHLQLVRLGLYDNRQAFRDAAPLRAVKEAKQSKAKQEEEEEGGKPPSSRLISRDPESRLAEDIVVATTKNNKSEINIVTKASTPQIISEPHLPSLYYQSFAPAALKSFELQARKPARRTAALSPFVPRAKGASRENVSLCGVLEKQGKSTVRDEDTTLDTPEANATRAVRRFCEPPEGTAGTDNEVIYLPVIVEAAESSPAAAKKCALVIQEYLSKEYFSEQKASIQYNAIMLIGILVDNPGPTFTRNIDAKFVATVKELLRSGKVQTVKQLMMETLNGFQREKAHDENLKLINDMWQKEQEKLIKTYGVPQPRTLNAPPFDGRSQNYFSRNHTSRHLPSPEELASRIEEAKSSAKLLSQVVQSTPPSEVPGNELIREFVDRCQSASRSIQAYMIAENPNPDNDTMETLIETNEMLSKSLSQHQRALLAARKALGSSSPAGGTSPSRSMQEHYAPPAGPPPSKAAGPAVPARKSEQASSGPWGENPFSDPQQESPAGPTIPFPRDTLPTVTGQFQDRLGVEPYHPGFNPAQGSADEEEREEPQDAGYGTQAGVKAPMYRY